MRERIVENWDFQYNYEASETPKVELIESNGKQYHEEILGIVRGESFFGDSFSRNGRFYPKNLWSNALKNPDTKRNLERGLMFACIGHPENYSLDELLASGAVAAKVAKIEYDGKVGMVEYHILNTPAGRILNTIFRAGSKPYVSTRAFGSFSNETVEKDGMKYKKLNENDFEMESIDFVINPGFLGTNPELKESFSEDLNKLKESGIRCKDGVCNLIQEASDMDKGIKMDKLEALDKVQLINIVEGLRQEIDYLINEDEKEFSSFDIITSTEKDDFKHLKQFVSYLELMLKFLRYDVRYAERYAEFVRLTSEDIFDKNVISQIGKFAEDVINDDVDESLQELSKYILKIIDINNTNDNDTKDSKDVDNEDFIDTLVKSFYEAQKLKSENKKLEKRAQKSESLIENFSKGENLLNKQVEFLASLNKSLTEELEQVEVKSNEKQDEIKSLEETVATLSRSLNRKNEEINNFEAKIESLTEKIKIMDSKEPEKIIETKVEKVENPLNEELKTKLSNVEAKNEELEQELKQIQELYSDLENSLKPDVDIAPLKESISSLSKEKDLISEKLGITEKQLNETINKVNSLKEYKVKFLQEKFRVEKQTIIEFCEKFNEDEVEAQLARHTKILKQSEAKVAPVGFDISFKEKTEKNEVKERLSKLV